ncbi:Ctr copper transporter [Fennellomyces sp. T-0311]|nr:Ctr copper transporter [Fennellomyces sp. T-0311]
MNHGSSGSMDHSMMHMGTFHWSSSGDALWFDAWMPKSEPAYIGACFGLLFFSIVSRGILAVESYFVAWATIRFERVHGGSSGNNVGVPRLTGFFNKPKATVVQKSSADLPLPSSSSSSSAEENPWQPHSYPDAPRLPRVPPFVWPVDTIRSFLTTLASFLNYLLMLVVMTGNGGFFIVVIVGIFIGEMIFGRFRSLGGVRTDHAH